MARRKFPGDGATQKANARWKRLRLSALFALVVFAIMLAAMFLVLSLMAALETAGLLEFDRDPLMLMIYFAVVSLVIGTGLAFALSKQPLKPLRAIMDATDRIAQGDYSARIDLRSPSEFRELSGKFNHMAEELQSVETLRSDFVSNVSHEFKTPIASIKGFAEQLQRDDLTPEQRGEYLQIICEESQRLSDLSSNVLSLSGLESLPRIDRQASFNLTEQVRLAIAVLSSKMDEKGLEPVLDGCEVNIEGDREMLAQVWMNLLDNAVKFSDPGGEVSVSVREEGEYARIEVANRGEAIPPEAVKRVFDRFYQADTSHATAGNGLGLAIARRIVVLHGGNIDVESGDGTTAFTVLLPISKE